MIKSKINKVSEKNWIIVEEINSIIRSIKILENNEKMFLGIKNEKNN